MRVDNEVRTRDLDLGKVALYQLSYVHMKDAQSPGKFPFQLAAFQRVKTLYEHSLKFQIGAIMARLMVKILVIPDFLTGPGFAEMGKTSPEHGKILV